MTTRPITRFIDVAITKTNPSVSAAGFGDLMCITDSDLVTATTRIKTFTTLAAVTAFFGASSEEEKYADAFLIKILFLKNNRKH